MTTNVSVLHAIGPRESANLGTSGLREAFLVEALFVPGQINLTYSHYDRMIVGGAVPQSESLTLAGVKETGTDGFLDRRELGIVNIGGAGRIDVGGTSYELAFQEALYVGMGNGPIVMSSLQAANAAQFYLVSTPAHRALPNVHITLDQAKKVKGGSAVEANARTINQYIHPDVCESCQLLVGLTMFEPGSIWNTMPAHLHDRRMEAYLYFGMEPDTRIFHMMGEPTETRHIIVKSHEAVFSPSWSIHAGAGTGRYSFIWAMAGDNISFTDMDKIPMDMLR